MAETGTRTVERALTLLSAVAQDGGTLSQLARGAELSPSTASRLLATLAGQGLVERDEHGRFRGGARLRQLAAATLRAAPVHGPAGEIVAAISVLAPTYRMTPRRVDACGRAVARHAAELSRSLGAPEAAAA